MAETRCVEPVGFDTYQTNSNTYQSAQYAWHLHPTFGSDISCVMHLYRNVVWTLFLFFALPFSFVQAQIIGSHVPMGGTGADAGQATAIDASGNFYVAGYFSATMDADPSGAVVNLTSNGGSDAFLAKYTSSGGLTWAISFGGLGSDQIRAIEVDVTGTIFVVGTFEQTVNFDPGGTFTMTSMGAGDGFVARYKSDGTFGGAIQIGGTGLQEISDIAVFGTDHYYITGRFQGTTDFDPSASAFNLTSTGSDELFLAQYSPTGVLQFANAIGNTGFDVGYGVAVDAVSNVYLTGAFSATVDFDPSGATANLTSSGFIDAFLARFDKVGNYQWAISIGGGGFLGNSGRKVAVDGTGIYIVGTISGIADFDPSGATVNISGGLQSGFVAKYDKNSIYQWAFAFMGAAFGDVTSTDAVAVDNAGYLYVAGTTGGTVDFDPSPTNTVNLTSAGGPDGYLARYDINGNLSWAFTMGGSSSDGAADVAATSTRVMGVGAFQGTADFDPSPNTTASVSSGSSDIWTTMYSTAVFPVEWAYLEAEPGDEGVWINWGTATETNTDRFVIERSIDGQLFEAIGETPAYGNRTTLTTYQYLDSSPLEGQTYYRLRQIDLNGQFAYSQLLTVQIGHSDLFLHVFPTPAHDKISFQLSGEMPSSGHAVELKLLSAQGTCVHHVKESSGPTAELDIRSLPPGLYFLQVRLGQELLVRRFVKV